MKKIIAISMMSLLIFLVSCQSVDLPELPTSGYDITDITDCLLTNYENENTDYCSSDAIEALVEPYLETLIGVDDLDEENSSITSAILNDGFRGDPSDYYINLSITLNHPTEVMTYEHYIVMEQAFLQLSEEIASAINEPLSIKMNGSYLENGFVLDMQENFKDNDRNNYSRFISIDVEDKDALQTIEDTISAYQATEYAPYFAEFTEFNFVNFYNGYMHMNRIGINSMDKTYQLNVTAANISIDDVRQLLGSILPDYKEKTSTVARG